MSVHYSISDTGVINRHPFYGDPADLPQPRKDGPNMKPLPTSRYHKAGYAERRAAASRVQHFKRRR